MQAPAMFLVTALFTALHPVSDTQRLVLCVFTLCLLEYHASEVLLVLLIEPEEFERGSFLLSVPYIAAILFGLVEHYLTWRAFPFFKARITLTLAPTGIALIVAGETLRKLAWLTARASFTHRIKDYKRRAHSLVTHGVYSRIRHPGYLGWLLWAVGTQVLLANPISACAFALVAWRFFRARIPYEEACLVRIFGDPYRRYRAAVPTWIPGIA